VAIAGDAVVTNAHVVAGARRGGVQVISADGEQHDARVVLIDPDLDVALLYVPDLEARALPFSTVDPVRGAIGAALGYPGGGPLTVVPAAVAGAYAATGRDIYTRDIVRRDILELHAMIDRGDSGGPFVLTDGTIGGLIFAESQTQEEVGYALAPLDVAARVGPAVGSTEAVSTGDCVR
jgi:S1-C subfamily serine protease